MSEWTLLISFNLEKLIILESDGVGPVGNLDSRLVGPKYFGFCLSSVVNQ